MNREERRQQVLEKAKEVFSLKGYHDASVSDIIRSAGVARGTFYVYFTNKRQVFESLLDMILRELHARIQGIELGEGNPPPMAQLKDNVLRVLSLLLEDEELTQILLIRAQGFDPDFDRRLHDFYRQVADLVEGSLRRGISMGLVRLCNTRVTAYCILGCIKEMAAQLTSPHRTTSVRSDLNLIVDEILNFGLRGVYVDPTSPAVTP